MIVLFNIPNLHRSQGGVYQYALTLLQLLAKAKLPIKVYIYCKNPDDDIHKIIESYNNFYLASEMGFKNSKFRHLYIRIINNIFSFFKYRKHLKQQDVYDFFIKKNNINIIHTPLQDTVNKPNVKSITTLHDVQELHYPEFFSSSERAKRAVNYKRAIDMSDAVVVSYDHIKNDIVTYFDKPKTLVHTILLDMQDLWFNKIDITNASVINKYNLPKHYILYPASTWQHKNHLKLFEALKLIENTEMNLVCTGPKTEFYDKVLQDYILRNNLENRIHFLGIVSDEALYHLYQNTTAVVVPTLYEAGSFPLMESILMKIPVICADTTSLPETIGDERFVFNPMDAIDIQNKIQKICFDENYRSKNLVLLEKQAKKLTNNNAASKFYKVYQQLMD